MVTVLIAVAVMSYAQTAPPSPVGKPFADVPAGHWAEEAIRALAAAGVMEGYPEGTFRGNQPVTRYEVAMALSRLLARIDVIKPGDANVDKVVAAMRDEILRNPRLQDALRGAKGDAGIAGPIGPAGAIGPIGPMGIAGPIGERGPKGDPGLAGAMGPRGNDGPVGPAGIAGPRGDIGLAGPIGPKGDIGPIGVAGPVGPAGPLGPQGERGLVGPQGERGLPGPLGERGPIGATGPVGGPGPKGDVGPAGPIGLRGVEGEKGPQGVKGDTGPVGAKGDVGPVGPVGAVGPAGPEGKLSAEQLRLLDAVTKLLTEFTPEIERIRGVQRDLEARVAALETNNPSKTLASGLRVSVDGELRMGLMGTSLKYNGGINDEGAVNNNTIFTTSTDRGLVKDALKGTRFAGYLYNINLDATLADNVLFHSTLRTISPVSFDSKPYNTGNDDPLSGFDNGQFFPAGSVSADALSLRDAYAVFTSDISGRSLSWTVGRHATSIAQGLLIDNDRQPLDGVSFDGELGNYSYGANFSLVPRALSAIEPRIRQDAFTYGYLGTTVADVNLIGYVLQAGMGADQGWGVGFDTLMSGKRVYGEYATMTQATDGDGWLVGVDLANNPAGFTATVKYGDLDPGFNPGFSALNPYAEFNGFDVSWLDRPLFLDSANINRGVEGAATYVFGPDKDWRLQVRGYVGDHKTTAGTITGDPVVSAMLSKQLNRGVTGTLVYAQRRDVDALATAIHQNLQVLEGRLSWRF
jgi:hypothetical protein